MMSIEGQFVEAYFGVTYRIKLELNNTKDKASLFVTSPGKHKVVQQFTVKAQNNDYALYYGKEEIKKMNEKGIF